MRELRVAVVDDDYFKREHIAQELDAHPKIAVVHALPQDEAVLWPNEQWGEIDVAIVDVFDEYAPGEIGTDMYSGIPVIERLRSREVVTIAVSPYRHHPLVEQRIFQAGANFLYRRYEVNDLDVLVDVLFHPRVDHVPQPISRHVLNAYGATFAKTNRAVDVYERSPLSGKLVPRIKQQTLHLPRRSIDRFTKDIRGTGFDGSGTYDGRAGYVSVRDYVLRLLGRTGTDETHPPRTR